MKYIKEYNKIDLIDFDNFDIEENEYDYGVPMNILDLSNDDIIKLLSVGDRIVCDFHIYDRKFTNKKGTIAEMKEDWNDSYILICVEFDDNVSGHDGIFFKTKYNNGHCRNFSNEVTNDDNYLVFKKL